MIVFLTHYPDYVVTIHRMHGELTLFTLSEWQQSFIIKRLYFYAEAV